LVGHRKPLQLFGRSVAELRKTHENAKKAKNTKKHSGFELSSPSRVDLTSRKVGLRTTKTPNYLNRPSVGGGDTPLSDESTKRGGRARERDRDRPGTRTRTQPDRQRLSLSLSRRSMRRVKKAVHRATNRSRQQLVPPHVCAVAARRGSPFIAPGRRHGRDAAAVRGIAVIDFWTARIAQL